MYVRTPVRSTHRASVGDGDDGAISSVPGCGGVVAGSVVMRRSSHSCGAGALVAHRSVARENADGGHVIPAVPPVLRAGRIGA